MIRCHGNSGVSSTPQLGGTHFDQPTLARPGDLAAREARGRKKIGYFIFKNGYKSVIFWIFWVDLQLVFQLRGNLLDQ